MSAPTTILLDEIMAKRTGSVNPSKYLDEVFDLYSIPAFDSGNPEVIQGSEIGSAKQIVQPGDVLLSKIVPHIRRSWVVAKSSGRRLIASGEWIVFRGNRFHPPYLRHLLVSDQFHSQLMSTVSGVGGSLLRARPAQVANIEIPLPPLPEQRRIAAILDKADAVRRKRQESIRLTEEFLRSVFLDMFGDPVTNPKGWKTVKIRELVSEVKYGTSGKASYEGQYPILRMNNITYEGGWDFSDLKRIDVSSKDLSKYTVKKDDILFNRTNSKELVGKTAVYREEERIAFAGYLVRVRPNSDANSEYIAAYLNSNHGKSILMGMCKSIVGMANINAQELQEINILKPPKELQDRFAAVVNATIRSRRVHQQGIEQSECLFASLSQRAFRGEL